MHVAVAAVARAAHRCLLAAETGSRVGAVRLADVAVIEGGSAHIFCLYGSLVDCLGCGDRTVVEAIQKLLRRLGDELAFAPAPADEAAAA